MSRSLLAVLAALLVLPAAPALAGAPGTWTPITSADGRNIDQVALLRTPDAQLHVVWHRATPTNTPNSDLMQTVIAPAGAAGPPQTIASNWIGIGDAGLVRDAAGNLLIVAGATQSLDQGAISEFGAWRSADGGASWALQPTDAAKGGGFADGVGLAIGPDGATPYLAWGTTFGLFVHRGTDAATPAGDLQTTAGFGCCGYDPGLAVDGQTNQLIAAWYSNATGHEGVYAQPVDPATGGPIGAPVQMPGSVTNYNGALESSQSIARTPVVARPGKPGVWVAYTGNYPTTTLARVWRFGAPSSTVVGRASGGLANVTLAGTPEGRLWALWSAGGVIFARRTNRDATVWGATVSTPVVKGTSVTFKLAASGQLGPVDVLAAFAPATGNGVQTWHTQLNPGLTLAASPAKLKASKKSRKKSTVTLTVTDAGDPVAGAKVKLGKASGTTNGAGKAKLKVGPFASRTSLAASATKAGYVAGATTVAVR